jgi:hypothetical protein
MAAIHFPTNPSNLDQHTVNGITYIWKEAVGAWVLLTTQDSQEKLATETKAVAFAIALS